MFRIFSGFWDQETVRIGGGTGAGRRGPLGPEGKEEESVKEAKS